MRQQSHVAELERRIREGEEERERTRAALARSVEEGRRLERMIAAGNALRRCGSRSTWCSSGSSCWRRCLSARLPGWQP
ncbi:hypothetical protein CLOM_g11602 [Closterium sp. NIES-68]|nr:hypothetical protein CLOM_g11602 [Closterium sp. NIES-68]